MLGCILLVFGSGGEYLVFGPVTSWTIALTALFGQLVLIDVDGPVGRRDIAASALGLVGMMSSGFGVIFAVAIAVSLAIRRRWSALAVVVGPQLLAFTWWWATFGKDQAADQVPGSRSAAPDYAVRGISAAFDAFTAVPALSGVVMIGAASFGFALLHDVRCSATVWGLGAATVSLYIVLGVQRSGFGIEQAASPRYSMVGAILLLPSIGLAVDRLRGWGPRPLAVAYVIAATSILVNLGRLQLVTEARGEAALQSKATYELVAGSPDFNSYDPKAIIDPHSENVTVGFIPWLVDHGMIEPRPATTSDEKATLAAIPRKDD